MPNDFYGVAWIFIMYAFVGWCCEGIFAALCDGKFVNRGFLAGPVCPIYGFGVLIVVCVLNPIKDNIFVLFIGSVLLTSALEFAAGWALERFLHQKWWDYTDIPFNIKGYVCLKFSLLWGLACVFVVKLVHPTLFALVMKIPRIVGIVLLSVFFAALVSDLTITLFALLRLPGKLRAMEEIEEALRRVSDTIGSGLSDTTLRAAQKNSDIKERAEAQINEKRAELEKLREKYKKTIVRSNASQRRILKAFPNLSNGKYKITAEKLKKHYEDAKKFITKK